MIVIYYQSFYKLGTFYLYKECCTPKVNLIYFVPRINKAPFQYIELCLDTILKLSIIDIKVMIVYIQNIFSFLLSYIWIKIQKMPKMSLNSK